MSRWMSDYSKRRVAGGATFGSGTDTCASCRKDKEPARLNYMRCLKCEARAGVRLPGATRSTGPKVTRRTRIYRKGNR